MPERVERFQDWFAALVGVGPLRWQTRLFARLVGGDLPSVAVVDLPTGLGKTSIVPIWLLARAAGACVPRRLVYIVNRRTVVDQATDIVEQIRERLRRPACPRWAEHTQTLTELGRRLRALRTTGEESDVLAVSTLRGELADNEEWKADPARCAIVVGTIDMIGSKLLFSGYGDGPYHRAHHAGLIGQDALIVHDEAHLTPAFSELLSSLAAQQEVREPRPLHVAELSATQRAEHGDRKVLVQLEAEDETDPIVSERLDAEKRLRLHEIDDGNVIGRLVELGLQQKATASKVLIYVQSPKDAQTVAAKLRKRLGADADARVAVLTGTIRGHERDLLVKHDPVYHRLLHHEAPVEETVYLVSTSAGEVGIDLDADHMVCDVTTLDAMIQRLGRVNRRGGEGRRAAVDVVAQLGNRKENDSELGPAIQRTRDILRRWTDESGGTANVCPRSLCDLLAKLNSDERRDAFSPKPDMRPLTDILLDTWSLTSIDDMPGRPEVAGYLHGLTHDPPETYLVWRKEVARLSEAQADEAALRDWFRACRVEARERLRDSARRVQERLTELLNNHQEKDRDRDFPVVLLDERGEARWKRLSEITKKGFNLDYRTVVLPVEVGGLDKNGMLDAQAVEPRAAIDVAEEDASENRRERWLQVRTAEGDHYERLLTGERADALPQALPEQERVALRQQSEVVEGDGEALDLVLVVSPRKSSLENPEAARVQQTLTEHTNLIAEQTERIAGRLELEKPIQDALVAAARWHDRGKNRDVWQRYARNEGGAEPLAKSMRYLHPRALGGYRHEFGSLLEAEACEELRNHPERDLILHLIAAHHGRARPHFEPRSFDNRTYTTSENTQTSLETMRRFGQLQQRFGRWGLAWLESLLRCADIAASKAAAGEAAPAPQRQEEVPT